MKTLDYLQTLSKIGKVLSKIVFVCSVIGVFACILGIILLSVCNGFFLFDGNSVEDILKNEAKVTIGTLYVTMTACAILCVGEAILSDFAVKYFKNELSYNTPFNLNSAKELLRLGILTICIPIASGIVAQIVQDVMYHAFPDVTKLDISEYGSAGMGIAFIIVSLLCRYGAQIIHNSDEGNQ